VQYDERTRRVVLRGGEAYFDVVKDIRRPFIVVAGSREIIALERVPVRQEDGEYKSLSGRQGRRDPGSRRARTGGADTDLAC